LYPVSLTDTIVRLHHAGVFGVSWSEQILSEAQTALIRDGKDPAAISRRFGSLRSVFPECMVDGYADLVPVMTCDEGDRHVLAAAVHAGANQLITSNLRDFPRESTERYGIEVVSPDDLLLNALDLYPNRVLEVMHQQAAALRRPPMTIDQVVNALAKHAPNFAQTVDTILRTA
jgi:hypothetical protein